MTKKKIQKEKITSNVMIRMTKDEKKRFVHICKDMKLSYGRAIVKKFEL